MLCKNRTDAFHYLLEYQLFLEQIKTLSYFEQLEQVFLVVAGGREAGTVYPVRHSVEQKSWVEPFLWYAVCPFCRIFLQPEQETRTAVVGTEGSILLMPEDATAGWKPDDSCGAKKKKNKPQRKHRVTVIYVLYLIHFCAGGKHKAYDFTGLSGSKGELSSR